MKEEKSKSQVKREYQALQQLGKQLSQLPSSQLAHIPLNAELLDAIKESKKITSHVAKKRSIQSIARILLQCDDITAIQQAYQKILQGKIAQTDEFHLIEQWRTRLLSHGSDALTQFIEQHPSVDTQQLRSLIRQANKEQTQTQNTTEPNTKKSGAANKALFRFLRTVIAQ